MARKKSPSAPSPRITAISQAALESFKAKIRSYYEKPRSFPWRNHPDPYGVLVSEFMLQQTQTTRVLDYFQPFLDRFPDFESLAAAPVPDLLRLWQGLGYNRRAMFLQRTAQEICQKHQGRIPVDQNELESLPGIGPNTAGAILCFAFDLPSPFIETNIKAALIHDFFPLEEEITDGELQELSTLCMDARHPRQWFYALVDYGVEIKKQHPNPSRRAKSWQRQSAFEGSLRQVRGSILRQVLASSRLEAQDLYRQVESELASQSKGTDFRGKYEQALAGLIKEGMVSEVDAFYGPGRRPGD